MSQPLETPLHRPTKSWHRRKQARPSEILDAAMSVFAEKGFAAARMEDIAAHAGVTKGTIYLYFQNKEDVFKSVARQHVGATLATVAEQAANHQGTVREFLEHFLGGVSDMIIDHSEAAVLPKIVISESGNFPELARFWREEVIDRATTMMIGILDRGVKSGELRADLDLHYVTKLCVAPVLMTIIWRTTFHHTDPNYFDYRKFLAVHLDVLMNGLAP